MLYTNNTCFIVAIPKIIADVLKFMLNILLNINLTLHLYNNSRIFASNAYLCIVKKKVQRLVKTENIHNAIKVYNGTASLKLCSQVGAKGISCLFFANGFFYFNTCYLYAIVKYVYW